MKIGEVFRYSRPYDSTPSHKDGLPNYFHYTLTSSCKLPLLESGINPIQKIQGIDGIRCPAILISSSPHKIGSAETPWQDFFDPDHGHIRYFGDNKVAGNNPANSDGNRALLEQFSLHTSPQHDKRKIACPIIFFRRVNVEGRAKGNVQFQGFGTITRAERITQYDRRTGTSFTNYVFDFVVFSLNAEDEEFSWQWISARRNALLSINDTLSFAPESWKRWVRDGNTSIERCRRSIFKLLTTSTAQQMPLPGSREQKTLKNIYDFYTHTKRKHHFEALAAIVAARIIVGNGVRYKHGWITPASSDGGADFVGRLDVGSELAVAKLVVLGQAKCEKYDAPTGGNHIARTVARLRRGWIGVYVTTSYFSEPVQREVLEDKYPIVLIHGARLAREVLEIVHERGLCNVMELLEETDKSYDSQIMQRDPEEILYE